MKHKILSLSLAAMLIGGVGVQAYADPVSAVQENKTKYKELSGQILNLNSQVSDLNAQIENLQNQTKENDIKIQNTQNQINEAKTKIATLQADINKKQAALGVRISAMYKSQLNFNPVAFLITSDNFGEFLSRLNAYSRIIKLDDNLIDSLLDSKKALDTTVANLDANQKSLTDLQATTTKNIQDLNAKKAEQQASIAKLNQEKASVLSTIEANENDLIQYSVNIALSSSSTLSQLENAKATLTNILPQLSVDNVRNTAQNAINQATSAIASKQEQAKQEQAKQEEQAKENANNNSNNSNSSNNNSSSSSNSNNSSNNSGSGSGNSNTGSPTTDYKKVIQAEATAYSGGTITAMGLKPVRNPNGISTIAVDPSVIPLGSKVYIPGYGYAIASDTGGAIKGNKIDLYMNSEQACNTWGRRPVTVYVIAYPGQW